MRNPGKLPWRFSLRTFLVLTMIAGLTPWLYVQHRHRREAELWMALDGAKAERDEVLQLWRAEYEALITNGASAAEPALREKYFAARSGVEMKYQAIRSFYGEFPKE
jgi:hypothetical protein